MKRVLMFCLFLVIPPLRAEAPLPQTVATFSVVAASQETGEVGVAVQSKFFGVGVVVPWARAGVGAVATQAFAQTTFGVRGLAYLQEGMSAQEAMDALLADDDRPGNRQVGIVGADGSTATFTGEKTLSWAGGATGTTPDGIVYAVQGNILAGPEVVEAMARVMEGRTDLDLAGRMVEALVAGQAEGGDARGMQSAALLVAQEGAGYGGYTDVKYDLRVDDAEDPFKELQRLLALARPIALTFEGYNLLYAGSHARAAEIFKGLMALEPLDGSHPYNAACALSLWGSQEEEALALLARAVRLEPSLAAVAQGDQDLDPVRQLPGFEEALSGGRPESACVRFGSPNAVWDPMRSCWAAPAA